MPDMLLVMNDGGLAAIRLAVAGFTDPGKSFSGHAISNLVLITIKPVEDDCTGQ